MEEERHPTSALPRVNSVPKLPFLEPKQQGKAEGAQGFRKPKSEISVLNGFQPHLRVLCNRKRRGEGSFILFVSFFTKKAILNIYFTLIN